MKWVEGEFHFHSARFTRSHGSHSKNNLKTSPIHQQHSSSHFLCISSAFPSFLKQTPIHFPFSPIFSHSLSLSSMNHQPQVPHPRRVLPHRALLVVQRSSQPVAHPIPQRQRRRQREVCDASQHAQTQQPRHRQLVQPQPRLLPRRRRRRDQRQQRIDDARQRIGDAFRVSLDETVELTQRRAQSDASLQRLR